MAPTTAAPAESEAPLNDLGPLAWVLDELHKSLDGATKAMHRFVRDAELARGSELGELDTSHLRVARQQLHQAVGALEMVGLPAPARLLHGMEAAVQKFVQRPELCSVDAAQRIERAAFALNEYLEGLLKGKTASSVALFPQYRGVMELTGAERIHPADLWPIEWRWLPVDLPSGAQPLRYVPEVRARLDHAVLQIVKSAQPQAAARLSQVCAGLSAGQEGQAARSFWAIAAGYFDAIGQSLLPSDIYTKRSASRILQQYAALAKGDAQPSERLAQDLVFFCGQAQPGQPGALQAVRLAYGLQDAAPVDYVNEQFGRFDPALLQQARKRIATAAESWSALAGGDTNRLKASGEQFAAVAESIVRLHPHSTELAQALTSVIDATVRSGAAPTPAVAMEVATSILYLEAAYEDLDPTDDHMAERGARLATRLQQVLQGAEPGPLEGWMEELYRRVSERQTMGSVVDELRASLAEVEGSLDQFFRNPEDKAPLREVPKRLAQMRGVFSVLGLDQPALAALRMRTSVEHFLVDEVHAPSARSGIFEKIGNSLGAMGLLIDMLGYQRAMAKKLFVYDEEAGEFKPLMGRQRAPQLAQPAPVAVPSSPPPSSSPSPAAAAPVLASAASAPAADAAEEEDLQDIFLEEAREVVQNGLAAARALAVDPSNLAEQTTLRRAFHTLKGSSRMVGLTEFGEAAWAFEQMYNAWLADAKPASADLIALSGSGMAAFGDWIEDIAAQQADGWRAADFRASADALRLQGRHLALQLPGNRAAAAAAEAPAATETGALPLVDATPEELANPALQAPVVTASAPLPEIPDFSATVLHPVDFDTDGVPSLQPAPTEALPELDLPDFSATQFVGDGLAPDSLLPDFEATRSVESLGAWSAPQTAAPETALDLGDFDFVGTPNEEAAAPEPEPSLPEPAAPVEEPLAANAPEAAPLADADEQVKVIGDLRLGIPLYNVFLNEADEWSRRLQVELSEWAMELHRPLADSSVALAHSLGGIAATVGFANLADIARTLEHALGHVQLHDAGTAQHAAVFNDAAEEIRRLLHQFAAGFLKAGDAELLQALRAIVDTDFAAQAPEPASEAPQAEPAQRPEEEVSTLAPDEPAPAAQVPVPEPAAPALRDHLDTDLFPIFQEEAVELLPALGTALRQWVARPENLGARAEALRVLHTLKGSARLAGAMHLGELAHHMESAVEALGTENLDSARLEPLLGQFDALQSELDALELAPRQDISQPQPEPAAAPVGEAPQSAALEAGAPAPAAPAGAPLPELPSLAAPLVSPITPPAAPSTAEQLTRQTPRGNAAQSVRVRTQLLDRMVNQAGEVMISRSRLDSRMLQMRGALGELTGNLERLRQQLRDVEVQAESQMQSRMAHAKEDAQGFDPLEFDRFTRVQELTRMMAESVNDVATVQRNLQRSLEGAEDDLNAQARQARELQRDLLRTRMVEFEGVAERLYGVVRQAAKESNKTVRLQIQGGNIEMDRGVLDRMTPAFEHILRNAVGHGIEDAATRAQAGKPATGTILLDVHQEGNDVAVRFQDDGGGLRLDKIRAQAIARHLIAPDQPLDDAQAAQLLFKPGFSTATEVTELSGRGIGMDVVMTEINALGGLVETQTQAGVGTSFKLVLPLTTAVTQVVMLRMGEFSFGVPSNLVETVVRSPAEAVQAGYASGSYRWASQDLPFYWGGALLQVSGCSAEPPSRNVPVAILRSAGQRVALHVDEVLGNREVVVKNLGPQLARLPGLAGMSVLASGAVVLIYNPVALATVYGSHARALMVAATQAPAPLHPASVAAAPVAVQAPLVLVVDDSITVRRVTQRLLKREGFRVALANDGLHALEVLAQETPAVVLSDIEMPRMDGFDLVRNIRGDAKLRDLPIIMITSRIAQKHRDHASELGVNHYLGKPYSEDELLSLIRSYCMETAQG